MTLLKKMCMALCLLAGNTFAFAVCPHTPVSAYTGHLELVSKYNPNDPTRSQPTSPDPESIEIQQTINNFSSYLSRISDYYVFSGSSSKQAIAIECLDLWLNHWANHEALLTDKVNHTGYAVRSWALSSISSASHQVIEHSKGNWKPNTKVKNWLKKLAYSNTRYYDTRMYQTPEKVNNHDFWAAWASAATGLITDDRNLLDWSYSVLTFSLEHAEYDPITSTAFWPLEIGRGKLGLYYSNFALAPITTLAATLPSHGYVLHEHQIETLGKLAEFTASYTLDKSRYKHLNNLKQEDVNGPMIYWSKIHNATINNSKYSRLLEHQLSETIKPMPQLGGDIYHLFVSIP